jgi:hypothetical protein
MNLNERKPTGLENMGDCGGIALRAAELYESAKAWQQEISKVTMLSNRGGKRRGEGAIADSDGGAQATVDVEKVHRLAKDPILAKVRTPAVSLIIIFMLWLYRKIIIHPRLNHSTIG